MAFELAKAWVAVEVNTQRLKQGLTRAKGMIMSTMSSIRAQTSSAAGQILGITSFVGALYKLNAIAAESLQLAERQINAEMRLEAVLKATGGATGIAADELKKYASQLQSVTTFGDESILETLAKLATFRSVTEDTFKRATELSLDLAASGFGSAESAAVMLGKALENPRRGLTALTRVGVSFSQEQETLIKSLTASGKLLEAQGIILDAVAGQVGGVARQLGSLPVNRLKQINNEIGDIKEQIGMSLIPLTVQWKESMLDVWQAVADIAKSLPHVTNRLALMLTDLEEFFFMFGSQVLGRPGSFIVKGAKEFEQRRKLLKQMLDIDLKPTVRPPGKMLNPMDNLPGAGGAATDTAPYNLTRDLFTRLLTANIRSIPRMRFALPSLTWQNNGSKDREQIRMWNREVGFEDLNRAVQEAMFEEPQVKEQKKTNIKLDEHAVIFGKMLTGIAGMATRLDTFVSIGTGIRELIPTANK